MRKSASDKPRLRKVCWHVQGRDVPLWQATYKGFTAQAVCPVWAYAEVLEKARRGY